MSRTLSASLIVKNEEATLEECLKSIAGVDEIVVLDTGSTDKTVEVARSLGAEIHEGYVWKDDFADARNTCLRMCIGDWILCIDADDRLDPGMLDKIHKAIAHAEETSENIEAIQVLMHCDGDQFYSDRVIKNIPEVHFLRPVHEYVNCKGKYKPEGENEITITFQNREPRGGDIWWIMKIIEAQLRKEPDDLRWQYVAGREYFVRGYLPNAIYWLERYFSYREQNNFWFGTAEIADAYFTLGWAYYAMLELKKAKECALKCLGFNADFQEACKLLSLISKAEGGEVNQERWEEFGKSAKNRDLNFKTKGLI